MKLLRPGNRNNGLINLILDILWRHRAHVVGVTLDSIVQDRVLGLDVKSNSGSRAAGSRAVGSRAVLWQQRVKWIRNSTLATLNVMRRYGMVGFDCETGRWTIMSTEKFDRLKSAHQLSVEEFMRRAGNCAILGQPGIPLLRSRKLCCRLILEEFLETMRAGMGIDFVNQVGLGDVDKIEFKELPEGGDLVELVDGLFDLLYVVTFAMSACGIPDSGVEIVDRNNLSKFGPGHRIGSDGKLIKPPGFVGPRAEIENWISELNLKSV